MFIPRNEFWLQPHSLAIADLDHDNRLDIVVASYDSDNVGILLQFDGQTFNTVSNYSTRNGSAPYSIALAHLNNDTYLDIVVANSESDNILLLYGYGDGTFGNEIPYSLGYGYHPNSIGTKDLNNDHLIDLVIACSDTDHAEVFMQMCLVQISFHFMFIFLKL